MSNERAGKPSGEASGTRKGGPATIGHPTNTKERTSTESASTAPVGGAPGSAAGIDGTKDGETYSARDQSVTASSAALPPDGSSLSPTGHAGSHSRRHRHKTSRRHRKKKAEGESASERLELSSQRQSRCDLDDDDDYQSDDAAPSYHDDARDYDDDGVAAVTAMLRAASAMQLMSCQRPHVNTDDGDTLYLLSLRDSFKRLSASQKSTAIIRIQTVLHEIEFGKP
ncbi:uncharacterized protein LOC144148845 [Haemaphysalis longicornis]